MKLTRKYISKDGERFVAIYRDRELLVVVPRDERAVEVFNVYQHIEDQREEKRATKGEGKTEDSFDAEFRNYFIREWTRVTATLKAKYGEEQLAKVKIVVKQ